MWPFSFYHQFLIGGFTQSLLLSDAGSILATATNWDELEIQEETESGSSVTSKIRLPTQVSSSQSQVLGLQKGNRLFWGSRVALESHFHTYLLRKSWALWVDAQVERSR